MRLVLNEVGQLQHMEHADGHRMIERPPGLAVEQTLLAQCRQRNMRVDGDLA